MANVLSELNPTLMDVARRLDPSGNDIADIVEIMSQQNPVLQDMVMKECNSRMVNKTVIRTGLPAGTWRKLYGGVQPEKSTTKQIQDSCGMLETYSEIDKALADMAPNKARFLLSESVAFLEGMNQTMASTLFYGDVSAYPERFEGLAPRYSAYGADKEKSSFNVVNGGGTGSANTSAWLVVWGTNTVHGIYPSGSKAGLSHEDLGQVTAQDSDGGMYEVYRTHYKWDLGLTLRDWRYVVRIANIDTMQLSKAGSSEYAGPDLTSLLITASHKIPNLGMGRAAIYCNRTLATALDILALTKPSLALKIDEVNGKPMTNFRGIPIRECDAILDTEAAVSEDN